MNTKDIQVLLKEYGQVNTNPQYGRVHFSFRRQYQLSVAEALLVDVIGVLSRKTGWCFASQQYLAGLFGISERSVRRMVVKLIACGLLEGGSGRLRVKK